MKLLIQTFSNALQLSALFLCLATTSVYAQSSPSASFAINPYSADFSRYYSYGPNAACPPRGAGCLALSKSSISLSGKIYTESLASYDLSGAPICTRTLRFSDARLVAAENPVRFSVLATNGLMTHTCNGTTSTSVVPEYLGDLVPVTGRQQYVSQTGTDSTEVINNWRTRVYVTTSGISSTDSYSLRLRFAAIGLGNTPDPLSSIVAPGCSNLKVSGLVASDLRMLNEADIEFASFAPTTGFPVSLCEVTLQNVTRRTAVREVTLKARVPNPAFTVLVPSYGQVKTQDFTKTSVTLGALR